MASALNSSFGIALQNAKSDAGGFTAPVDSKFKYIFFSEGTGIGPVSDFLPLDQEVGAGPLIRDIKRVGIHTEGMIRFIPRAQAIGLFLFGALGSVTTTTGSGALAGSYHHKFKFAADQFSVPYFAMRRRIGAGSFGDEAYDIRIAGLQLEMESSNFVRATATFLGAGVPKIYDASAGTDPTSSWGTASQIDVSDTFLTCKGAISIASGADIAIASSTSATPIVVTTSAPHGLATGNRVTIAGHLVNTPANGTATVTVLSSTTFSIDGSVGTGVGGATGSVSKHTSLKVLSANLTIGNSMPIDEQKLIGQYGLDNIEIVSRQIAVQFVAKVNDSELYRKMAYGVTGTPSYPESWVPRMYREAGLELQFQTEAPVPGTSGVGQTITFKANDGIASGTGAAAPNIVWSCQPIGLRGNRQVLLQFSGTIVADPSSANNPFQVDLVNDFADYTTT